MLDLIKRFFHRNPDWDKLRKTMRGLRRITEKGNSPKEAITVIAKIKGFKMSLPPYLLFELLAEAINRFGLDSEIEEIVASLEKVISKNESVKIEHLSETVRRLGTILQNRDAWDVCTSPSHHALFRNVGFVIEESNESRWKKSGEAKQWVEEHHYSWNHQDWLLLLENLRNSPYWPMDPDKVGVVLEDIKQKPFARLQ
jgi:hypothetical protein